jgi:hypothetical protein
MSKNNPPNPTSLANNLVHTGTGDINYSNYVEPVGHTPCDETYKSTVETMETTSHYPIKTSLMNPQTQNLIPLTLRPPLNNPNRP